MGLDIYGKKDYIRFNWTGSRVFQEWCFKNQLPQPFIKWNGNNDGKDGPYLDLSKDEDRESVKEFLDAYEKKFPEFAEYGYGEAVRNVLFDKDQLGTDEKWDEYTGLAYYMFLRYQYEIQGEVVYS